MCDITKCWNAIVERKQNEIMADLVNYGNAVWGQGGPSVLLIDSFELLAITVHATALTCTELMPVLMGVDWNLSKRLYDDWDGVTDRMKHLFPYEIDFSEKQLLSTVLLKTGIICRPIDWLQEAYGRIDLRCISETKAGVVVYWMSSSGKTLVFSCRPASPWALGSFFSYPAPDFSSYQNIRKVISEWRLNKVPQKSITLTPVTIPKELALKILLHWLDTEPAHVAVRYRSISKYFKDRLEANLKENSGMFFTQFNYRKSLPKVMKPRILTTIASPMVAHPYSHNECREVDNWILIKGEDKSVMISKDDPYRKVNTFTHSEGTVTAFFNGTSAGIVYISTMPGADMYTVGGRDIILKYFKNSYKKPYTMRLPAWAYEVHPCWVLEPDGKSHILITEKDPPMHYVCELRTHGKSRQMSFGQKIQLKATDVKNFGMLVGVSKNHYMFEANKGDKLPMREYHLETMNVMQTLLIARHSGVETRIVPNSVHGSKMRGITGCDYTHFKHGNFYHTRSVEGKGVKTQLTKRSYFEQKVINLIPRDLFRGFDTHNRTVNYICTHSARGWKLNSLKVMAPYPILWISADLKYVRYRDTSGLTEFLCKLIPMTDTDD